MIEGHDFRYSIDFTKLKNDLTGRLKLIFSVTQKQLIGIEIRNNEKILVTGEQDSSVKFIEKSNRI